MKNQIVRILIAVLISLNIGCSATTYGKPPEEDLAEKDVYTFTLYKNLFASTFGKTYMREKSGAEISEFMKEKGYVRYEILNSERKDAVVNKNTYKVRFYR